MRRIFPVVLLAIGLLHCAGANAEDAKPCEDGAAASVSGTIKSIDHILAWWVTLEDGSQGTWRQAQRVGQDHRRRHLRSDDLGRGREPEVPVAALRDGAGVSGHSGLPSFR
jgi:hypothetical protein